MEALQLMRSVRSSLCVVQAAVETCMRLHLKQPEGHILLFMTGQQEIDETVEVLGHGIGVG